MIERLPPQILTALRKGFLEGENGRLPTHLGHYLQWFGVAEVNITTMLVMILNLTQWQQLEYLVRGMDARAKCDRLRQAAKAYRPLGKNLKAALNDFERDCIPLRNRIAHSWPLLDPRTDIIHFGTFGRMPGIGDDKEWNADANIKQIHIDDLFSQAMWLNTFAGDLTKALNRISDGKPLEIDDPVHFPPQEDRASLPPLAPRAKRRKRAKKPPETRET